MKTFKTILIANRGEIAVRIIRTCREMGIATVAVYSDFDRDALHVRLADEAVPIGSAQARESYLNIEKIIAAARLTGAQAIHPGYGFLAENATFASACEDADIAFIGPRASVIAALGSKSEARKLAQEAGVPVVPTPAENEFPKLIKASLGGGGRGMRIVRNAGEFKEAYASARGEAERAFGDGELLVEKYIEGARHVEVQIFGDHHGGVMHLFERDCSVQRRHQKIIEESPSPAVTSEIRRRMTDAAMALARKVGYTNAGTVEFLLAPSGDFYFIEVNTRIQVEHPVTEMVTGLDLIRLQIEIAQDAKLPGAQPQQKGHAIEVRLYAEDPANDFLPSTGTLHVWNPPQLSEGLRIDSGVEEGSEIGVYYDPLLAKVIAHAGDRDSAIRKLTHALRSFAAQGLQTNREFLIAVLESEEFKGGRAHTGFQLPISAKTDEELERIYCAVTRAYIERTEHARRKILPSIPPRFCNNPMAVPAMKFTVGGRDYLVGDARNAIEVISVGESHVDALVFHSKGGGVRYRFNIRQHGADYYVRSSLGQQRVTRLPRFPEKTAGGQHQSANSPMPGQVLRILVAEGQQVKPGDGLIVLEAMKMEQTIKATIQGVVRAVLVKPAEVVAPGQMLVEIEALEDANEHASSTAAKH
ncbi:MAG TPA: biotin carboxylase N-terminal domain-containing protein [Candidatus Angelobacter sp.]|nr:biotin carboxylase N-terminal domain-containing protein [Candidatus Angelobacter sp.]